MVTRTASFPIFFPGKTKAQKDELYSRLYNEERALRLAANKIISIFYSMSLGVFPMPSKEDPEKPGFPLQTTKQVPARDFKGKLLKQSDLLNPKKQKTIFIDFVDENGNKTFVNTKVSYETNAYRLITNNNLFEIDDELKYNKLAGNQKIYAGNLNTSNLAAASSLIAKKFSLDKDKVNIGEKTLANFKTFPIIIRADGIKKHTSQEGVFLMKIFNEKNKNKIVETKIGCHHKNDAYLKNILLNLFSGEYKIGASRLILKKRKWFLEIAYSFSPSENILKNQKVLGIDLGIKTACVCAVISYDKKVDDKIYDFKLPEATLNSVEKISKEISKRSNFNKELYEQRVGRGVERKIRNISKLSGKRLRSMDTAEKQIAAAIINLASQNNCNLIGIENLTGWAHRKSIEESEGLPAKQRRFKRKFYAKKFRLGLLKKIEDAAQSKGIKVVAVDAKNTSKTCSCCGYLKLDLKLSDREYKCNSCGKSLNRDFNAAINIAHRAVDA
jgi:IS605 OrfB family transposase